MVRSVPSRRCPIGWRRRGPVAAVLLLGSFLAVPGGTAHGQDPGPGAVERLAPDRPGFSTGTHTVTPGRIYLEVGIGHSLARGEAVSETQAPQATVRTGVLPGLEVFVEWEGWTRSRDGEPVSAAGPALGTKVRVLDSERLTLTALGVVARERNEVADGTEVLAGLMGEVGLGGAVALFGGLQATTSPAPDGRQWDRAGALGVEWELSSRWVGLLEIHSHRPFDADLRRHGVEWGLLFFPTLWVQVDVHAGLGLNDGQSPWLGAGLSIRR